MPKGWEDEKERKRRQLEENVAKGRLAEEMYEAEATMSCVDYRRTGRGSDYEETHHDPITGRKSKKLVEVKSDDAPQSRLQKKIQKKNPRNYEVRRYDTSLSTGKAFSAEKIFNTSAPKKKTRKPRKTRTKRRRSSRQNDYGFNMNNVFGSEKPKRSSGRTSRRSRRRKDDDYGFNTDNVFGGFW